MSNFNMFAKNNPSITSSERTQKIRNTLLYNNHKPNTNTSFKNHKTYSNLKNGFINCKITNGNILDNSNCFQTWIDNDSSTFIVNTIDDWNLSKVDYSGVNLNDNSFQDISGSYWPYKNTYNNKKKLLVKDYIVLNTNKTPRYYKNFKHLISRKNINL